MTGITRVEVIGPDGRLFSHYFDKEVEARAMIQDSGRTLKVFLDNVEEEV